ncbi:hypothetical protein P7C70_g3592, partial [Phenoliferia sp. Uapishka_3]
MVLAAVAQLCSKQNVLANLALCHAGAKLIWLPEASDFIADAASVPKLAQPLASSSFVSGIKDAARLGNIWVGVGVHESSEEDPKRCYNTNVLIDPQGNIVQAYRKVHLFDVNIAGGATILESNTTMPGSAILDPVATPIGSGKEFCSNSALHRAADVYFTATVVGLLTCYDLRFPEANLILRKRGAQVITYPSAFTMRTGAAHWNILLRARAIESQAYVLASAQVGFHSPTRQSYGNAMIVDPWGTVLCQTPDKLPSNDNNEDAASFAMADIDLDWLHKIRLEMPLWEQRRPDVYPVLA